MSVCVEKRRRRRAKSYVCLCVAINWTSNTNNNIIEKSETNQRPNQLQRRPTPKELVQNCSSFVKVEENKKKKAKRAKIVRFLFFGSPEFVVY